MTSTAPAPGESFTYSIRFRCASTFEHCTGAQITDTLPSGNGLTVVSYSQAGGLVTGVTNVGGTLTWSLKEPLTAGSTGLVTVTMAYPICATPAVDPGPIVNSATFSTSNAGSLSDAAPAVDGAPIPACVVDPTPPPGLGKRINSPVSAGGQGFWILTFPSEAAPYTVEDVIPAGQVFSSTYGYVFDLVEVDCGAGWVSAAGSARVINSAHVPPGCAVTGNDADGTTRFPGVTRVRWTVPANVANATANLLMWMPESDPGTSVQNCITATFPGATDSCGSVTLREGSLRTAKGIAAAPTIPLRDLSWPIYSPTPTGWDLGPMDLVYGITAYKDPNAIEPVIDPTVIDLLPPGVDFIPPSEGGTNSYMVRTSHGSPGTPAPELDPTLDPECNNPTFEAIKDFQGTGRTLLRWSFPGCVLPGGTSLTPRLTVFFSATISPLVVSGTDIINRGDVLSDDPTFYPTNCRTYVNATSSQETYNVDPQPDTADFDGDGNTTELLCPSPSRLYTMPLVATADSSKWVKGALDTAWSRYPASGDTDTSGDGEYELYLTNQGNTPLTTFDLIDVLPHVGDTSVTSPASARGSEWGEQLVSLDSIERAPYNSDTYTEVPAGELVTGFSASTNPCRWDTADANETNRLKASGGTFPTVATVSAPSGCDSNGWTTTVAGARSFALRYTPATALQPGETIRIKVTVELAPGEAPAAPVSGKIAWNSFGFSAATSAASPNDFLLSTEPIQVGLKMTDTSVTASLGDFVWVDTNHDGVQNEVGTGIPGVTVSLYKGATLVDTTLTDAGGLYQFWGLDPDAADYSVRLDNPSDYTTGPLAPYELTITDASAGTDDTDNDASIVSGTAQIAVTPTGAAGSHTPTYDFGFWEAASLGDYVWEDIDANGSQDSGEPGVEGVTVELFSEAGLSLGTTTTDATGYYIFDELVPGTYYVVFDTSTAIGNGADSQPYTGYRYTTPNATGDEVTDSDPNSDGRTAFITLVGGQHDPRWDAGITSVPLPVGPNSIGNYTWIDLDSDGFQDLAEPVLAGVTVTLLDSDGFPFTSTVTDAAGLYLFSDLPDGDYSLRFEPPPGYTFTDNDDVVTADDTTDSDADTTSGYTIETNLDNGADPENDMTWDAGFVPTYSLGNLVWADANNSGAYDGGEAPLADVVVNLLDGAGDPVLDAAGAPITMLTNSTGNYLFTGLIEGDYIVEIVPPAGGYISSTGTGNAFEPAPDPDDDVDSDDNGTTVGATIRSAPVTLSYVAEPAGEGLTPGLGDATPDTNGNYTVDFGIFIPPPSYDLALAKTTSTLEVDSNGDDISWTVRVQNQGSVDSGPFTVSDTMPTGTSLNAGSVAYVVGGSAGSSVGTPVPVVAGQGVTLAFTDATGLVPGGFVDVTFTTNVDDITKAPFRNWAEISADSGDDDDSSPDTDTGADQVLPTDGYVSVTDLATLATDGVPGVEPTGVSADADDNDDAVVGRATVLAVGDFVWFDLDRDGVQDAAELPVVGATAHLLMEDPATPGSFIDATHPDGSAVADDLTNADGFYLFDNLSAGNYKVEFTHNQAGYRWTLVDAAGGTDVTDSDATFTLEGDTTATTAAFLLAVGEANVAVVTAADATELNAGSPLVAAQIDRSRDAGIWIPVAVGDYVWYDEDHDGLQGAGENGAEDVTVTLQNADGSPALDTAGIDVPAAMTDVDGWYSFDNLLPGDYKIVFSTLPTGWAPTTQDAGVATDDDTDSDADVATLTTDVFTLVAEVTGNMEANLDVALDAGFIDPTIDLGLFQSVSLGDVVWYDANRDGIYDPATELGVEGVTATLTMDDPSTPAVDFGPAADADGDPVAATSTDPAGRYSFTNLLPGTYRVTFTLPTGYEWTVSNTPTDDTLDSDVTFTTTTDATATTGNVILSGLTPVTDSDPDGLILTDPSVDAGIWFPFAIGDYVWFDLDRNGAQDVGELAVVGATAHLTMDDGTGTFIDALDADGVAVADDTTNAQGLYLFDNLLPGTYRVTFTHNQTDYRWTEFDAGADGADSDAAFVAEGDLTATTGDIVLAVGEANVRATTGTDDTTYGAALRAQYIDPTNDAGIWLPVAVGDYVWYDIDHDGMQDSTEVGVEFVTVTLRNGDGSPAMDADGNPVGDAITDADGWYSFDRLLPGDYQIAFSDLPTGWAPTVKLNDALIDDVDSDADPVSLTTDTFTLTADTAGNMTDNDNVTLDAVFIDPTIDMGIFQSVSLGDLVWYDANRDGVYDPDTETGIEGVTVTLTMDDPSTPAVDFGPAEDADGEPVGSDTTDAAGRYSFTNLISGTYRVTFTLPNGYEWTVSNTPADDTLDSDATFTTTTDATATTGGVVLSAIAAVSDSDPDGLDLTDPSVDAGVWFPFALGDLVWFDLDHDGAQDGAELPVVGATAHLTMDDGTGIFIDAVDADGVAVADDITDAAGLYLFDNLLPGTYRVTFTHNQSGYLWTVANAATAGDVSDSDATFAAATDASATTGSIVIAIGEANVRAATAGDDVTYGATLRAQYVDPTNDAGIWVPVAVGDFVWYDLDRDGMQDPAEDGVNGVTVELVNVDGSPALDADGVAVPAAMTAAHDGVDGWYAFGNLVPGDYQVKFSDWPAGWAPTFQSSAGSTVANDSNPGNTGVTPTFTLSADPADGNMEPNLDPSVVGLLIDPTIDMGIFQSITLGDLVWFDADRDGVKDPVEVGVEGVRAHLTMEDPDVPGTFFDAVDADGAPIGDEFTDFDGRYSFTNLISTSYKVTFTLPSGYEWTVSDTPGDDTLDSDVVWTSTTDATATTGATPVSALVPVTDSDPDGLALTNPSIDAGIWFSLALGDVVWFDLDRDGVQDSAELPVAGATVSLLMEDPATPGSFIAAKDADGGVVADDTTDAAGRYLFDNLLPGVYRVVFDHNQTGYRWTAANDVDGTDFSDSDATFTAETDATASTGDIVLSVGMVAGVATPSGNIRATTAGDDTIYGSVLRASFVDPTNDAGIWLPLAVGDVVWYDIDHDGVQDELEVPVEGVTVTLVNADGSPAVDADGMPVPAAMTDVDGGYVFDRLLPGDYRVVFSTLPAGFVATLPDEGVEDADDSDADPVTLTSPTFTLSVDVAAGNMELNLDGGVDAFLIDPTVDMGIWAPLAIGDVVWYDVDRDGIQDEDEAPLEGITVTLLDGDGNPAVDADGDPVPPTTTDVDGHYVFDNLLVGDYQVQFTLPTGAVVTYQTVEDDEAVDSNPDETGVTPVFVLDIDTGNVRDVEDTDGVVTATRIDPTIDAGIWFPLAVGDYVWFDLDRDGIQETGELPVVGVTAALLMEDPATPGSFIPALDADGDPVAPVNTDANGHYVFDNLLEGVYQVQFSNLPATYQVTRQAIGTDRAVDSNPDSTGLTPVFELTFDSDLVRAGVESDGLEVAAFIDPTIDMGLWVPVAVGDYVWNDINHDGIQDTGEAPVAGVTVTLLNADGTPAVDAEGTAVPAAATDAAGHYVFDNLLPGSYVIQFSNLPAGFEITRTGAGTVGSDSNADPAGRTAVFTLTASGGEMRTPVEADGVTKAAMINPTIDTGIWKPLAVGDHVWVDYNRNGIQDLNELPVANVKVELLNPDGTPAVDGFGAAVPPVKTDSNGHYLFDNLIPGDYKVRFSELPKGSAFTVQNGTGSSAGDDSNPDKATGITPVFTLDPADPNVRAPQTGDGTNHHINPTIDAGLVRADGGSGALPVTGGNTMRPIQLGLLLLGAGAILTATTGRRRKQRTA